MITLTKAALAVAIPGLVAASLTLSSGAAHAAPSPAPLLGPGVTKASRTAGVIADHYIVVLKDAAGLASAGVPGGAPKDVVAAAAARSTKAGGSVGDTFTNVLQGYSATLSSTELAAVRSDPAVEYVQRDMIAKSSGIQTQPGSWGLDRLDQRSLPVNKQYYYSAFGTGVTAYVMDTGIFAEHPDFGGRVKAGVQFIGTGDGRTDCEGHGTHVAGTIGGQYYGVAKGVSLIPVRVLDCAGNGSVSRIISALDWIRGNRVAGPAVVNLSLGSAFNQAFNDSTQALIDSGVTVVAAAGNGDENGNPEDACTGSPGSLPDAITVAASTITDRAASYSNYGTCVDLYAPGEDITSDIPGKRDGFYLVDTYSGTSMAAPHVTGTAALYLQKHPTATPAQVWSALSSWTSKGKITGAPAGTPANLLFSLEPFKLPATTTGTDRLLSGQSILRDGTSRLTSKSGTYYLQYRASDGQLCLYTAATGSAHWCNGKASAWTAMSVNGTLNSYDAYGKATFTAATATGAATMVVNDKGYIYVKRNSDGIATWSSPH